MIFDILDMLMTYVQYLSLLVIMAPDSLPLFYTDTINVIKYFVLDLFSSFGEEDRYSNPLRVVLPDWLPLDVRLQFVIVVTVAPLALATLGFLVVFNKPSYLWFILTLGALFCFVFGALLVANKDLYADHAEPTRVARVSLLSVGLPVFLILAVVAVFAWRSFRTRLTRRELRSHERYVGQELREQEAKALMYDLVDREHLDVDLLAAERSGRERNHARIRTFNVLDACLQSFMVVCLCLGGLICLGAIPIAGMGRLQGSVVMTVAGIILLVVAGFSLLWLVLSLFRQGRSIRLMLGGFIGMLFLNLVMMCCTTLYTTIVTTFVSVLYCDELTCAAGSRPPHAGALFPTEESATGISSTSTSKSAASVVMVGCSTCNIDAYPQQCAASWRANLCSGPITEPRLTYDARVLCSQVDSFYRVSAAIMLSAYLLFVPIMQLVLACYSVDLVRRRFPLESRAVELFTPLELFYEKVLSAKNHASFMYSAYKPYFRYYRVTFLMQKVIMAIISSSTKRGSRSAYVWVGLMLFMIVPLIVVVCALVFRPFTRPTETVLFPMLQSLVALFAMVVLIAERTGHRLSYGVGVLLLVLAVAVPLLTLVIGTVLTLRMEQRRYNLLLLRLQLVMNKAASGNKGNASFGSLRGSRARIASGELSPSGTCPASALHYNWLERLMLRFIRWLDPEIERAHDSGGESDEDSAGSAHWSPARRRSTDDSSTRHMLDEDNESFVEDGAVLTGTDGASPLKKSLRTSRYASQPRGANRHSHKSAADGDFDEDVDKEDVEEEEEEEEELSMHRQHTDESQHGAAAASIPRRERARAVLLVGGAAEEAEEATRRHFDARQRASRGASGAEPEETEMKAVDSYWRRCLRCGCDSNDDDDEHEYEDEDEDAKGGTCCSRKDEGRLFAMTGERAVLRKRSTSKLARRVAEYDTAGFLFIPEAYFLRCYYPDKAGAGGGHGRFWTLFADLLRPTVRRFSDDTSSEEVSGTCDDGGGAYDNRTGGDCVGGPSEPSTDQTVRRVDPIAMPSPSHPASHWTVDDSAAFELEPSVAADGAAVAEEETLFNTVRRRRAQARVRSYQASDWITYSRPSPSASEAADTSALAAYEYAMASPNAHTGILSSPTGAPRRGPPPAGGLRHRGRHRFQLLESPSDTSATGLSPGAVAASPRAATTTTGVTPLDPDCVFAESLGADAFLFAGHNITPRKSDAGGLSRAAAAAAAASRPSLSPAHPRVASRHTTTGHADAQAMCRSQTTAPAVSQSVGFRTVGEAFGGTGASAHWNRSPGSREGDAARDRSSDEDEDDDDDDDEADARAAPGMTCCRAMKLFLTRCWHGLQEWLGVRYTQDAVLRRLQQRDGLGSQAHTLLTYPVVFKRRQAGEEVRLALGGGTTSRTASTTSTTTGSSPVPLPYPRPYWRQPSTAMLGTADVRGGVMPWALRTRHAAPSHVAPDVAVRTPRLIQTLPSSVLSMYGLIERHRRQQYAESDGLPGPARPSQNRGSGDVPAPMFLFRVQTHDDDIDDDDDNNRGTMVPPPDVPSTLTYRQSHGYPHAAHEAAGARGADDGWAYPGLLDGAGVVLSESASGELGRAYPDRGVYGAAAAPPLLVLEASDPNIQAAAQAASWAAYCLTVAQETLDGFQRFWQKAKQRAPVTTLGRVEEHALSVPPLPPSDQLRDPRFMELLREVLLPDASSDDEDADEDSAGLSTSSRTHDDSHDTDGDRSSTTDSHDVRTPERHVPVGSSPSPHHGPAHDADSSESVDFDALSEDSPAATPRRVGARWAGVDAAMSRRVTVALLHGRGVVPETPLGPLHTTVSPLAGLHASAQSYKRPGAAPLALMEFPPVATTTTTTSEQGPAWQSWMVPSASLANSLNSSHHVNALTKPPVYTTTVAATACAGNLPLDDAEVDGDAAAACLRLLRCHYLLRERLADLFWAQRRRLRHVQYAVNDKISRVVRVFLAFLFVWLGLIACISLALAFGGMLHTVDTTLVTGTRLNRTDAAYQLAGYQDWGDFTSHCCCTAAENLNASLPFYALDVESWLCENGKVKERVRRDAFDDDVHSGYRVRGLCGMSFLNGCALQSGSDDVVVVNCTPADMADYELIRW